MRGDHHSEVVRVLRSNASKERRQVWSSSEKCSLALTHSLSLSTYLCGEGGVSQNVPNGAPRHNVNQGEPGRVSRAEDLGLLRIVVSAIDKKVKMVM